MILQGEILVVNGYIYHMELVTSGKFFNEIIEEFVLE